MCDPTNARDGARRLAYLSKRIKELGEKSSQLLLFLSFAIAAAVILRTSSDKGAATQVAPLTYALKCWGAAMFPVMVGILPVKEFGWDSECWYSVVRASKCILLWAAVGLIAAGAVFFIRAI
jgi:hypothetical protein